MNSLAKIGTSSFKRLIGFWKTEGTILNAKENSTLVGTDSYEFILDGNFILHKADVKMGNEKSETFELISVDNSNERGMMHYYNSKAEQGEMSCSLIKNNFKIEGDKLKFEGTINEENTEITGKWYIQAENEKWTDFIDLRLEKQSTPTR